MDLNPNSTAIPSYTSLPPAFFDQFNITSSHIQDNSSFLASSRFSPDQPNLPSFTSLHQNHDPLTNVELLYEVLLQCYENVDHWTFCPFEVFVHCIDVQRLTGGFSNFLISVAFNVERAASYKSKPLSFDPIPRPESLQILTKLIQDSSPFASFHANNNIPLPSLKKVAVRIYGTLDLANRLTELDLAQIASQNRISEHILASWRHGRVTTFLQGSSVGTLRWHDPIVIANSAYLQGQLHATTLKTWDANNGTWLFSTLRKWSQKAIDSKVYQQVLQQTHPRSVSSVFDMFIDPNNQLYMINQPASLVPMSDVRLNNVLLPLPPRLAHILVPLLNAPQIDTDITQQVGETAPPFFTRNQRVIPIKEHISVQNNLISVKSIQQMSTTGVNERITTDSTTIHNYEITDSWGRGLSIEDMVLLFEYLDLPRMCDEIDWIESQCREFPIVTAHNDFHQGNVLLLDSIDLHTCDKAEEIAVECSPPIKLSSQPIPLPNEALDWFKVIDFEYCGLNFRGFDLANSLNEAHLTYDGPYPGFSIDFPALISTQLLGEYDPNILLPTNTVRQQPINITQHPPNQIQFSTYTPLQHPALNKLINQEEMNHITHIWNQPEPSEVSASIQSILLGVHSNQQSVAHSLPKFRPKDIAWVQSCLIGYYHAYRQQERNNAAQPTHQSSSQYPYQPHIERDVTIEQWLEDQTPKLLQEAMLMSLGSFLTWSFWGMAFTDASGIHNGPHPTTQPDGFGYLEHALVRMIAYVAKKQLALQLGLIHK